MLNRTTTLNANKVASPLSRKATLCGVNVSMWSGRRLDRKVTAEINAQRKAKSDAGRYNKLLVRANRLEPITQIVSAIRALHYAKTKPWGDKDGFRILPNVLYVQFANEMRELIEQFDKAADHFAKHFHEYVEERKPELGGIFRPEDYPSVADIRSKFKANLRWSQLPEVSDFRADVLDKDTMEDIRSELAASAQEVEREAMTDTYRQVADVVGKMVERLSEFGTKKEGAKKASYFMDSLVGNVRDLVELLPAFNLTGDSKLDELTSRMAKELCVEEAKTLRENETARETVKKSAEDILAEVSRVMA
jgi:hypothetical protein